MDVLVVGGGIAGLSATQALVDAGADPLLLEASPRVGGVIHTDDLEGAQLECGPQGFLAERPGVLDVVRALGLEDQLLPAADAAGKRYVLQGDRLIPLPSGPAGFLRTPLLSARGRLRVLAEPWAKGPPPDGRESVWDFAARRLGREAADVLVDALVTGIFAGDPKAISLDACFPRMRRLEREHGGLIRGMIRRRKSGGGLGGARLVSFKDGMKALPAAYARRLHGRIRTGVGARELRRSGSGWEITTADGERLSAERVLLTAPAAELARILKPLSGRLAERLAEIRSVPVAVVGLVYSRERVGHPLDGYGFLAPGGQRDLLGCLFETTVFPSRAPEGKVLLRAMVGGARRPEAAFRDKSAIISQCVEALRPLLDLSGAPDAARVVRWKRAIPQYDLEHPARLEEIERELSALPGLFLGGAPFRGVSVNRLVADAKDLARQITNG